MINGDKTRWKNHVFFLVINHFEWLTWSELTIRGISEAHSAGTSWAPSANSPGVEGSLQYLRPFCHCYIIYIMIMFMSGLYIILYIIFLLYQSNFFDLLTIFPGPCRDYFPLPTSFGEAVPIITVVYQGLKKMSVWGWTWLDWLAVSLCFLLLIRTLFVSFELMIGRWPREGQPKCLKSSKSQKKPSETGFVWACAPKSDDSFISSIFKWEFGVPPKTDSFLPVFRPHSLSPDFGCEARNGPCNFFQQTFVVLSFFHVHPRWWRFF